ncbi:16S rRNA (guanine(527)-N(7))-methyltransferase RsmG [Nereida sp.]|uniref:16S rRNA (guanine(527)-N(7))-methyltransferase RsmG n=1 Tax=Nereida sp. TaxID=2736090 RepID=UPI003F6A0653
MDVSRETSERLQAYEALIRKWNPKINLVSPKTLECLSDRHINDSLQICSHIGETTQTVADLGSGGGLPGIVIAIYDQQAAPNRTTVLVESDARKGAFLRTCIRELSLNARVETARIERLEPLSADVITARALASLDTLFDWAHAHGHTDTECLFLKGRTVEAELAVVRNKWSFELDLVPSKTDPEAKLLKLKALKRA